MRVVLALFLMLSLIGAAHAETKAAPAAEATYVRAIQDELTKLGYYHGEIDGKLGPQTEEAIGAWQHASGRKVDGIPTAAMVGQMRKGKPSAAAKPAKPTAAPPPAEPEAAPPETPATAVDGEVAAVQKLMLIEGYYHGVVDGRNGPQTQDAIKQWQENHGMARTGEVDAALLLSLAKSPTAVPDVVPAALPAPAKPAKTGTTKTKP
jgi:peptidoglycan hydrolase-like protein with peptidoglycan-binding domain